MEGVHGAKWKAVRNTIGDRASAKLMVAATFARCRDVARRTKVAVSVLRMAAARSVTWKDARRRVLGEAAAKRMVVVDDAKLKTVAIGLSMADDAKSTVALASAVHIVNVASTTRVAAIVFHMVAASPARFQTAQRNRYESNWHNTGPHITVANDSCVVWFL